MAAKRPKKHSAAKNRKRRPAQAKRRSAPRRRQASVGEPSGMERNESVLEPSVQEKMAGAHTGAGAGDVPAL